ncbi:restriction endonuclease subunit S [Selenomonas sp.]|uniref:restriction endonuclease subunit S n=1 Tax=Selenomonas sp. TaxID=2053611 RepID=UPI0025D413B7|nr:restriction endonuclease subunit S [Selenomonas sp.]MCI6282998.1 restriction endonuclease subunit S [Selenomonas sp.]
MMLATALRKSILQAAIAGELTEQRADDGDARDLLAAIRKEKTRLVRAGKLKKERALPEIREDDVPFEVPENWCWARLGEVCVSITDGDHQAPPKVSDGTPFLVISNISSGTISFDGCRHVPQSYFASIAYNRRPEFGDLLFTVTGSYGIVVPVQTHEPFCFQRHMALLKTRAMNVDYLMFLLQSPLVKTQCDHAVTGTAQKTLALNSLKTLLVPIPPLQEQQRIVEHLTILHEELKTLESDERELDALTSAFPARMKSSLLLAAMRGELTEREEGDGDARDLLKTIEREKKRLIKEKRLKREKPLPPVAEEDVPFEIPETWCWCRLGDVCFSNIGLTYHPTDIAPKGTLVLRSNNIQDGRLVLNNNVYVTCEIPETKRCRNGDILICVRNGSKKLVGKSAIINCDGMTFGAFMAILRSPFNPYIHLYIQSPLFRADLDGVNTTTINQITQTNLKNRLLPLPPLAEQRRIVARLEELLGAVENG